MYFTLHLLLTRVDGQDLASLGPVDLAVLEVRDDLDDLVNLTDPLLGRVSLTGGSGKSGREESAQVTDRLSGSRDTDRRVMVPFLTAEKRWSEKC